MPLEKNLRMWIWNYLKGRVESWLSDQWTEVKLGSVRNSYYALHIGVLHKYSAVFTKQGVSATSCVCVSQILLMSCLNQLGPIPRPLTSIRPLAEVSKTPTHIFPSPPTIRLSTAPTLFLSPPSGFSLCPSLPLVSAFFFFFSFTEDVSGVCVCVC